jgi:hypothetical protein
MVHVLAYNRLIELFALDHIYLVMQYSRVIPLGHWHREIEGLRIENKDHTISDAVSRRPLTSEARVRAQGFMVDRVALRRVSLRVLWFPPVSIIPS